MQNTLTDNIKTSLLKLFMIFVEIFCIMMVVVSIQSGEMAPIIIPFIVVPTIFSIRLLVPNYYRCMDAVRGYISYGELKRLLKGEEFHKLKLTDGTETEDVYESEHFLYAAKVYVPKELVMGVIDSSAAGFDSFDEPVKLALNNGRKVIIGEYNAGPAQKLVKSLHAALQTKEKGDSCVKQEFEEFGFCRGLRKIYDAHASDSEKFEQLCGLKAYGTEELQTQALDALIKDVAVLKIIYEIQSYIFTFYYVTYKVGKDNILRGTHNGIHGNIRCEVQDDEISCVCTTVSDHGDSQEHRFKAANRKEWDYTRSTRLYDYVYKMSDELFALLGFPPVKDRFSKKVKHTKNKLRRRKGFEKTDKKELLTDAEFLAKLEEHLQQFTDLGKISINKELPQSHEQPVCQDAIPLYGLAEQKDFVSTPYQQLLKENESEIWEKLLSDDSIECIADKIRENLPDGGTVMIYLTNDCSSFDEYYTDAFGILFEIID